MPNDVRTYSQTEVEHRSAGRQCAKHLDDEDEERCPWPSRQPLDRERCHRHHFQNQPKLKDVRGGPLVRLSSNASDAQGVRTITRIASDIAMGTQAIGRLMSWRTVSPPYWVPC
jgi:hypothetical protein